MRSEIGFFSTVSGLKNFAMLGFLGKPSIQFRAKYALSEADAPFARTKREGFRRGPSIEDALVYRLQK